MDNDYYADIMGQCCVAAAFGHLERCADMLVGWPKRMILTLSDDVGVPAQIVAASNKGYELYCKFKAWADKVGSDHKLLSRHYFEHTSAKQLVHAIIESE